MSITNLQAKLDSRRPIHDAAYDEDPKLLLKAFEMGATTQPPPRITSGVIGFAGTGDGHFVRSSALMPTDFEHVNRHDFQPRPPLTSVSESVPRLTSDELFDGSMLSLNAQRALDIEKGPTEL